MTLPMSLLDPAAAFTTLKPVFSMLSLLEPSGPLQR